MMNPVRATTGWLAGRLLVFLFILAALVALDAYREESSLMGAMLKGMLPNKELVERLANARTEVEKFARDTEREVNRRLRDAQSSAPAAIDGKIEALQAEIKAKEGKRLSAMRKTVALMTGQGLEDDLKNEVDIQLNKAELVALIEVRSQIDALQAAIATAVQRERSAWRESRKACAGYQAAKSVRDGYARSNSVLANVPFTAASQQLRQMNQIVSRWGQDCTRTTAGWRDTEAAVRTAKNVFPTYVQRVESASASILEPLDELIATKTATVEAAEKQANKIQQSIRNVFLKALGILIAVTLAPVGIKALWYCGIARFAERRRPVQLRPGATGMVVADMTAGSGMSSKAKVSAVSQDIEIDGREELLVHPEFLQSSADRALKRTKVLLSWQYWFMSIAANMVFLDRIRAPDGATLVVSSKNDAFAEVGVIALPEGTALVLQPRNLVGLVQPIDQPVRITRKWNWSLMAFITLQFRYLIFEGPGKLIVQGCRGVRVEQAGSGRSIDQAATIGFSANLNYSPKRSETFGAYLLGTRGLFNDRFTGGPGVYVYEEMPYFGKKSGITGRGLEGLTDGLMKVVGI